MEIDIENGYFGFEIEAAAVFPDMKQTKKGEWKMPGYNFDYKYAIYHDGTLTASKDTHDFVMALAVFDGEEILTPRKIREEIEAGRVEFI